MNKYSKILMCGASLVTGVTYGETFEQKLDAYLQAHQQEINQDIDAHNRAYLDFFGKDYHEITIDNVRREIIASYENQKKTLQGILEKYWLPFSEYLMDICEMCNKEPDKFTDFERKYILHTDSQGERKRAKDLKNPTDVLRVGFDFRMDKNFFKQQLLATRNKLQKQHLSCVGFDQIAHTYQNTNFVFMPYLSNINRNTFIDLYEELNEHFSCYELDLFVENFIQNKNSQEYFIIIEALAEMMDKIPSEKFVRIERTFGKTFVNDFLEPFYEFDLGGYDVPVLSDKHREAIEKIFDEENILDPYQEAIKQLKKYFDVTFKIYLSMNRIRAYKKTFPRLPQPITKKQYDEFNGYIAFTKEIKNMWIVLDFIKEGLEKSLKKLESKLGEHSVDMLRAEIRSIFMQTKYDCKTFLQKKE